LVKALETRVSYVVIWPALRSTVIERRNASTAAWGNVFQTFEKGEVR